MVVSPKVEPVLDPGFVPAVLWNKYFRRKAAESGDARPLLIALERSDGTVSVYETEVLPHQDGILKWRSANERYVERLVKFLLWQKGGFKVTIAGDRGIADYIKKVYSPGGEREFDFNFIGEKIYGKEMVIEYRDLADAPQEKETDASLGRNFDGC